MVLKNFIRQCVDRWGAIPETRRVDQSVGIYSESQGRYLTEPRLNKGVRETFEQAGVHEEMSLFKSSIYFFEF